MTHHLFRASSLLKMLKTTSALRMKAKFFTASSALSLSVAYATTRTTKTTTTQVTVKGFQEILKKFHCTWSKVSQTNSIVLDFCGPKSKKWCSKIPFRRRILIYGPPPRCPVLYQCTCGFSGRVLI